MNILCPKYASSALPISRSKNKGAENGFLLNRLIYIINNIVWRPEMKIIYRDT
jgi:hypothetical protein